MASEAEVLKVILDVAGHPDVGALKDLAPTMARRIVELDTPEVEKPRGKKPQFETRVEEVPEQR